MAAAGIKKQTKQTQFRQGPKPRSAKASTHRNKAMAKAKASSAKKFDAKKASSAKKLDAQKPSSAGALTKENTAKAKASTAKAKTKKASSAKKAVAKKPSSAKPWAKNDKTSGNGDDSVPGSRYRSVAKKYSTALWVDAGEYRKNCFRNFIKYSTDQDGIAAGVNSMWVTSCQQAAFNRELHAGKATGMIPVWWLTVSTDAASDAEGDGDSDQGSRGEVTNFVLEKFMDAAEFKHFLRQTSFRPDVQHMPHQPAL